ncbi:hypothetical protein [Dehalobacterium formicoaceticum]|uniref:Uncharacterized protein n=1 Tax=Dehalobacterium formicoaceticum TaxID=51515 RepID=A0ABT1Y9B5_9FIRM|nr:hypothetical protein [Dehalobacterium formicoaceticum]MCR6546251.1 hypothetical protein [Dehalobacterium formicoaceticum]
MEMSVFRLIFYGIPEYIALVALAYAIARINFEWPRIALIGVFLAFTTFLIRLLPITFGVHTLIIVGLFTFYLTVYAKIDVLRSVSTVLITYFMLVFIEAGSRSLTLSLLNLSMDEVKNNDFLIIVTGWPEIFIILGLAYGIKRFIWKER